MSADHCIKSNRIYQMKKIAFLPFVGALLLWFCGCACLRGNAFNFENPSSVVAHAWRYIEQGYAHDEGTFRRDGLRLSQIDYSRDAVSVEVSFYVLASFKTNADGRFTCKLLDIEMDKNGKLISASTADHSQGGSPLSTGF